jgi:hypothetical protein
MYFFLFIYLHVHTLFGSFLPHSPPSPSSSLLHFQSEPALLYREITSIAFMYKCVTTQVDSSLTDLYTGSRSPSRVDLCHFKVSVLVPLEWGHQTLSCFGFSTYSYISHMCSPLVMWSKSSYIATFALDLKSTYEGEHTIFGLLSLANLAQNNVLQFHPFTCKW